MQHNFIKFYEDKINTEIGGVQIEYFCDIIMKNELSYRRKK